MKSAFDAIDAKFRKPKIVLECIREECQTKTDRVAMREDLGFPVSVPLCHECYEQAKLIRDLDHWGGI